MITVIVATHNGEGWISRSLSSFTRLAPPQGGWKLVVVNNGSTDRTGIILNSFKSRLPLEVLDRPQPGKNAALNAALGRVEGELVVFADDDVLVEPDWLVELARAAEKEPNFVAFGGAVRPGWPRAPDNWILNSVPLGTVFAVTPPAPRGPCPPEAIWGPNMAVRREVFRAGFRFDEGIGPDGSARYAMGSETSFTRRLAAIGQGSFHVPEAAVTHLIRPAQLEREWIVGRAYRAGRGKGMLAQELEPAASWVGVPRYFFRQAGVAALHYLTTRLRRDARGAFRAAWEWHYALGCISGARAAATGARAAPRPGYADAPNLSAPAPG